MSGQRERRPVGAPGRFITFEGIEGSGKSTQISRLAQRLGASGEEPIVTKEPGGTALGLRLRSLLLETSGRPITPLAELLLYVADRAQHLQEVVQPALSGGRVVLCDRYLDATIAYQGHGRGLPLSMIEQFHRAPPLDQRPDRTLLLDLEPEAGVERARRRNRRLGVSLSEGRFEEEAMDFHRRVRQGYLELAAAEPDRFRVLPASLGIDELEARVIDSLRDLLPSLRGRAEG